jgi:hypothetical protein
MFARTLSLLAACTLALAQPLAGYCACIGCSAKQSAEQHAAALARSCCANKAAAPSCCKSTEGCRCGHGDQSEPTSATPRSGDIGLPACGCSVTPPPAATASHASAIDQASAHAVAAAPTAAFVLFPQLQPVSFSLADLPPPGGGLRIHALYRVWQI